MLEQFLNHIERNKLLDRSDKILLAVSGGIDSMVMLHLFKEGGFHVGLAHCNFQLRGKESEEDAGFVEQTAIHYQVQSHIKTFDTKDFAVTKGISVQMAARDLRYVWFDELSRTNNYKVIATAHNLNDVLETILLNLVKGTGLDGLAGIPIRQQKVVRPLLFASRKMIETYARENKIAWREDSSNVSDEYQRNFIRNKVVPLLHEINPGLEETFTNTLLRLNAGRDFARSFLKEFSVRNIYYDGKHILIKKEEVVKHRFASVMLWELLKDLGFNFDQCEEITKADHSPGTVFQSRDYKLVVDREEYLVRREPGRESLFVEIMADDSKVESKGSTFTITYQEIHQFTLRKDERIAQLDADKIQFPMIWRNWIDGDRFIPLGMQQHKKISDFLIDEKVSLPDKDHVTVVESGGEIIWVVGKRIADPYRVTPETRKVILLKVEDRAINKAS